MLVDDDQSASARRAAVGAFSHEIRTPLTSLRMILELAQRDPASGDVTLDSELADMLTGSLRDLESLADALHDLSRLERRKLPLGSGPTSLAEVISEASSLSEEVRIECAAPAEVVGPWDAFQLARAIADLALAVDHLGEATGNVHCEVSPAPNVTLTLLSGDPSTLRPGEMGADLAFRFFRARELVLAMKGELELERGERAARLTLTLPDAR
jgi:signal transduction histidine kinase